MINPLFHTVRHVECRSLINQENLSIVNYLQVFRYDRHWFTSLHGLSLNFTRNSMKNGNVSFHIRQRGIFLETHRTCVNLCYFLRLPPFNIFRFIILSKFLCLEPAIITNGFLIGVFYFNDFWNIVYWGVLSIVWVLLRYRTKNLIWSAQGLVF